MGNEHPEASQLVIGIIIKCAARRVAQAIFLQALLKLLISHGGQHSGFIKLINIYQTSLAANKEKSNCTRWGFQVVVETVKRDQPVSHLYIELVKVLNIIGLLT